MNKTISLAKNYDPHLTEAFEANSFEAKVSRLTMMVGEKPSKVKKMMMAQLKINHSITKAPTVTKVAQPTKVEKKEENDQHMVQETKDDNEALENPKGSMAEDEELYGENEEYGDEECLEEILEEFMKQLEKQREEKMAKFRQWVKGGQDQSQVWRL